MRYAFIDKLHKKYNRTNCRRQLPVVRELGRDTFNPLSAFPNWQNIPLWFLRDRSARKSLLSAPSAIIQETPTLISNNRLENICPRNLLSRRSQGAERREHGAALLGGVTSEDKVFYSCCINRRALTIRISSFVALKKAKRCWWWLGSFFCFVSFLCRPPHPLLFLLLLPPQPSPKEPGSRAGGYPARPPSLTSVPSGLRPLREAPPSPPVTEETAAGLRRPAPRPLAARSRQSARSPGTAGGRLPGQRAGRDNTRCRGTTAPGIPWQWPAPSDRRERVARGMLGSVVLTSPLFGEGNAQARVAGALSNRGQRRDWASEVK